MLSNRLKLLFYYGKPLNFRITAQKIPIDIKKQHFRIQSQICREVQKTDYCDQEGEKCAIAGFISQRNRKVGLSHRKTQNYCVKKCHRKTIISSKE